VATVLTQFLARVTPIISSRINPPGSTSAPVKVTGRIYLRTILPIGILYTVSLVCSNLTYLHLSVSFIQMLKSFAPVSTLFLSFFLGFSNPRVSVLYTVLVIAFGVLLSSIGEVRFSWVGFGFQMGGTVAESLRLLMIQGMLSKGEEGNPSKGLRMDPLVGLYYYAPVCAFLNGLVALVVEYPTFDWADLERVGYGVLGLNGLVAFLLNVASVFLVSLLAARCLSCLSALLRVYTMLICYHHYRLERPPLSL
jgi:hypothetical protein